MALNANVGTAWISVVADTGKLSDSISGAIQKAEKGMSGEGLGKKLASGLGKTLKVGVATAGVAAGGILATSLTKGLGRLSGIENAQAKLAGLGHEAEGVEAIMDNALTSVKGTAYGLEDAATVAASAVAAGIKPGKDLERTLKLTGDAANIAGVDMATMGSIVNKVATSDMMQMDVANQMMDAGIPILQMVADEMGVTAEEARKMASDGKVSFETFQSALEEGVGGAALKAGETVQGSFANMGAAAGRFGAKLADPAFTAAPAIFTALGGVFDEVNDAITPATDKIGNVLTPALESLATIIEERVAPWMADLAGKAGDLAASGLEKALDPESWTYIADIFGKVRDTVAELWPSLKSLGESFLTISQSVSVATWEALTSVLDALAPVVESVLVPLLEKVAAFAAENPETVEKMVWAFLAFKGVGAIAGPVGTATKTLGNLGGAVSGVSKAFKGATFGQGLLTLMGGAKSANPILAKLGTVVGSVFKVFWKLMPILTKVGKVFMTVIRFVNPWVAGITLVVGALTWFFTQTEMGQAIVETVFNAIKDAWNWVVEAVSSGWENYIKPALEAFWQIAQNTIAVIGTLILAPLLIAWNLLSAGIKAAWEGLIKPAWDAFASAISALWNTYAKPIFSAISSAWDVMSSAMSAVWQVIKTAVFDAWNAYVNQVKANWDLVTGLLSAAWQVVSDRFTAIWGWIRDNVFQPMMDKISELWNSYASPIFQWVGDKWDWLRGAFGAGWDWIRTNVFDAMGRGLDVLKDWFQAGVDGIAKIWDGLKAAAAGPVRFVVDTVWNNGILAAWNSIAEFLPGIDTKDKIPLGDLGGYASGGVLPGYTPGRDVHEFYSPTGGRIHLSGGEAIMRPEWTRAVGGEKAVAEMNRAARAGQPLAYKDGGVYPMPPMKGSEAGLKTNAIRAGRAISLKFPEVSVIGGYRPYDPYPDHPSGRALDVMVGNLALGDAIKDYLFANNSVFQMQYALWKQAQWTTASNGSPMADRGNPTQNHYDHVHAYFNDSGYPTPGFDYGAVPEGAGTAYFGAGGGVSGFFDMIMSKAKGIWDKIVDPIKGKISSAFPDGDSSFNSIPGAALSSLAESAWSHITGFFGGASSGQVDTSDISGPIVDQVEQVFSKHGFTGAEWEAAKWIINKESSWDPNATNPSSGAYGLFQFNPMGGDTLGQYLPSKSNDPAIQADAGARYMKNRYGTPSAAKRFWEQNHWYANGGVIPSGMGLFDTGGVWKSGTMGMNLSGKNEYVFTNRAMRDFQQATESLQVVAKEIGIAFNGGDWGYGELSRYVGEDIARALVDESANLGIAKDEIDEAFKGGDWGYGALSRYVGEDIAHAIVNEAAWLGGAKSEIVAAFDGVDGGLASVARYLGGNERLARDVLSEVENLGTVGKEFSAAFRGDDFGSGATGSYIGQANAERLLDEVSWIGATFDEVKAAWKGQDSGYAGVMRYLGGNAGMAISALNAVESAGTVATEISEAFSGRDWGTGEMERYVGPLVAQAVFDTARAAGSFMRREHDDYIHAKYGDFGNLARSLEVIAAGGPSAWGQAASDVINTALNRDFAGSRWMQEDSPMVVAALHIGNTLSQWQSQWASNELSGELRKSAEDYAMGQARSALSMVGLGDVVDIATGVNQKVQGIMSDEEVRKGVEEVKRVVLDPDGRYSGAEIEKKLRELGIEIDHIKSDLDGSLVGGLIGMA